MPIIYHGTSLENAARIAQDGALLSPYLQEQRRVMQQNQELVTRYGRAQLKQQIESWTQAGYSAEDFEKRKKRISLTRDLLHARVYAWGGEQSGEGVILGLNFTDREIYRSWLTADEQRFVGMGVARKWIIDKKKIFFIEQVSLKRLQQIYFSTDTGKEVESMIKEWFGRFNPEFHQID